MSTTKYIVKEENGSVSIYGTGRENRNRSKNGNGKRNYTFTKNSNVNGKKVPHNKSHGAYKTDEQKVAHRIEVYKEKRKKFWGNIF